MTAMAKNDIRSGSIVRVGELPLPAMSGHSLLHLNLISLIRCRLAVLLCSSKAGGLQLLGDNVSESAGERPWFTDPAIPLVLSLGAALLNSSKTIRKMERKLVVRLFWFCEIPRNGTDHYLFL
jgi:hypothetical protein